MALYNRIVDEFELPLPYVYESDDSLIAYDIDGNYKVTGIDFQLLFSLIPKHIKYKNDFEGHGMSYICPTGECSIESCERVH